MPEAPAAPRPRISTRHLQSEDNPKCQRDAQATQKLGAGHLPRAEAGQVGIHDLGIEQYEAAGAKMRD